jgi:hypothetical protein
VLRALVLMRLKNWDYHELRERIADGITLRQFTDFHSEKVPRHDAFNRSFNRLTPATLKAINELVIEAVVQLGVEDGSVLTRLLSRLAEALELRGIAAARASRPPVRRRYLRVRAGGQPATYPSGPVGRLRHQRQGHNPGADLRRERQLAGHRGARRCGDLSYG